MTLGFSTKFTNGKETNFVGKIWSCLEEYHFPYLNEGSFFKECRSRNLLNGRLQPKKHTIRKDSRNRWKKGNLIHMVIENRTKNRFQFAPILKVTSIQEIKIIWKNGEKDVYIDDNFVGLFGIEKLALNDGFESVEDFFNWFSEDFTGKIIHWAGVYY